MADQAQYIERIKNLEQTNQVLVESNHYYKNHIDQLNQMINDLKRYRFGKRSEVYHHPDQQHLNFLQDVEPAKVIETESVTIEKHTRKKTKRNSLSCPLKSLSSKQISNAAVGRIKRLFVMLYLSAFTFSLKSMRLLKSTEKSLLVSSIAKAQRIQLKRPNGFYPKQV